MPATLHFHADPSALADVDTLLVVGRRERLLSADVMAQLPANLPPEVWKTMVEGCEATDRGRVASTYTASKPRKIVAGVLPENCSRHNSPSRAWAIAPVVRAAGNRGPQGYLMALDDEDHAFAVACGLAPALPSFSATSNQGERTVHVAFLAPGGPVEDAHSLGIACEAVRDAAKWVDMPPDALTTEAFVDIARQQAATVSGVHVHVVQGEHLREQGLGGLWGVGRAAENPPALVVLDYDAGRPQERVAWVGKGVVYDTGGLSLKTRATMVGMKGDMGGAAAVLASFIAAVRLGVKHDLTAVLCIAENAIGPRAVRPDDVLTLASGKTVEVNNTDAEGRLVLADGLAWVSKYREPTLLVDMATLTGAQGIATGRKHAAIYCNDESLEARAVLAGRASGDLIHPLPYAPELFRGEFTSQVADMRNSVKNRSNAQSSCAGQFLANHLADDTTPWLHIDMAAPAFENSRGTGYGVALLLTLAGVGAPL